MVDQMQSPPAKKDRPKGKLSLPEKGPGMNKTSPNNAGIEGKGKNVGPKIPADEKDKKASSTAKDEEILDRIRKRMERCIASESDNRKAALDDRKFKAGDQWPADILAQRNTDKRPALTVNRMKTFVHQVTNPARENRPQINISPRGERADKDGAKMFEGLIRAIERDSHADIAYDTALDDAVTSGWGYMRLLTEWKSETSFDQVLVVKRIRNPFTVYLDPDRLEPDGSDSRYGFVTEIIPEHEFKEQFPDAQMVPFNLGGIGEKYKEWVSKDGIRVAEYYEVTEEPAELVRLSTGWIGFEDEIDEFTKKRVSNGSVEVVERRTSAKRAVKYYKVSAVEILERNEWIGKWVPIVEVVGDEIDIEGKVKKSGIIRDAKDAQRQYNYWCPLALDTPIPTPSGWTTMAELHEGDTVFNEKGEPVRVKGESPTYIGRDCFRVTFDGGHSIIADGQHPWTVERRGPPKGTTFDWRMRDVTTSELRPGDDFIYVTEPLAYSEADLPIHPYLLGLWLGDGSTAEPRITAGEQDVAEVREILEGFGQRLGASCRADGKAPVFSVLGVRKEFTKLGLLGNKHIPEMYLRAAPEQRRLLLQGLMDSDGSIGVHNRQCSFTTTLPALSAGFSELLRGLGYKAKIHRRDRKVAHFSTYSSVVLPTDQFSFSPLGGDRIFGLQRKQAVADAHTSKHWRRTKRHKILSVEPVPSVPVKCIAVDTPSHLFLAGEGMVATHNTTETELVALAPKAPWIIEEGQLEGHEKEWQTAHTKPKPFISYKGTSLDGHAAPPPQRAAPVEVSAGVVTAKQGAAQDMMATTGIRFDSTLQERMHDESGKALRELNRKTDIGAFHYYDNFRRSLIFLGKQMVDAIPKLYTRKQVATILREDIRSPKGGPTEQNVTIDPMLSKPYHEARGEKGLVRSFNPAFGEYDVDVDIGPSYATKRQEASESMMAFVKAMPQTAQLVMDLIASEMDWPGAEKIANRLAKAIPPQMLTAEIKDIPPQIQALIQNLEMQSKQLTMQLQLAMKELNDKNADRELQRDKMDKDFEAKILAIVQKAEQAGAKLNTDRMKADAEHLRASADMIHEHRMDHAHLALETQAQGHGQHMSERAQDHAEKPKDGDAA